MDRQIALRDYQASAAHKIKLSLDAGLNPVACLPAGSGKSLVIAEVLADSSANGRRSIVLTHRKELIRQDYDALQTYAPGLDAGIYSAGLGIRDTGNQIIFGGVQSVFRANGDFGKRDLIIIDEADLCPESGGSMYRSCFDRWPDARRAGLTATPYRLNDGLIYGQGPEKWFDAMAYQVMATDLIASGWLSPLVGKRAASEINVSGAKISMGDYVIQDLAERASTEGLVKGAVDEILEETFRDRRSVLVFGVNIEHCSLITQELLSRGAPADMVHGMLSAEDRDAVIARFKAREIKYLVNCEILGRGFDYPEIDCIALLRPTNSKALHVQQIGRGMRLAKGKRDALILDFSGNCRRCGSPDLMPDTGVTAALKRETDARNARRQEQLRAREELRLKHRATADVIDPMRDAESWVEKVRKAFYLPSPSRTRPGCMNVLVIYHTYSNLTVRRWLCPEYPTGAAWHAKQWLAARGAMNTPRSAAAFIAEAARAPLPSEIVLRMGSNGFHEVVSEQFTNIYEDNCND